MCQNERKKKKTNVRGVQYVPKSLFFYFLFFSLNRKMSDVLVAVAVVTTTAATPKTSDSIGSMKKNNRAALTARSLV